MIMQRYCFISTNCYIITFESMNKMNHYKMYLNSFFHLCDILYLHFSLTQLYSQRWTSILYSFSCVQSTWYIRHRLYESTVHLDFWRITIKVCILTFKFEIIQLLKSIFMYLNKISAVQYLKPVKYDAVIRLLTYVEQ